MKPKSVYFLDLRPISAARQIGSPGSRSGRFSRSFSCPLRDLRLERLGLAFFSGPAVVLQMVQARGPSCVTHSSRQREMLASLNTARKAGALSSILVPHRGKAGRLDPEFLEPRQLSSSTRASERGSSMRHRCALRFARSPTLPSAFRIDAWRRRHGFGAFRPSAFSANATMVWSASLSAFRNHDGFTTGGPLRRACRVTWIVLVVSVPESSSTCLHDGYSVSHVSQQADRKPAANFNL